MLTLDFTFTPFDMNLCYSQTRDFYNWGWYKKDDLRDQVKTGILPAEEYKKITGEDYAAPQAPQE